MSDRIEVTATIRAVDQASAAIQSINRSLEGLKRTAASIGSAFRGLSRSGAFGGLAHNVSHLGGALQHAAHGFHAILEPLAAIAGIAGGFSVGASLESYIGDAEHLALMSKTLGTTADQLGAYENAAKKAGVETEGFDKSMQFAQRNMRKGALGIDKKEAALFGKLGIDLRGIRDGSKSAMDYMPQLADAMKAQHSAAARSAIAFAIFGRAGGAMIPFLMQGSRAIREQTKAYLDQDHITDESAKKGLELGHAQKDLARTFTSLRDAVGNAITPTLIKGIERFQEAFARNRPKIVKDLTEAIGGLATTLAEFDWDKFYAGVGRFFGSIRAGVAWIGGWRNALIGLIIVINGPLIAAVLEIGIIVAKLGVIFGQLLVQAIAGASRAMLRFAVFAAGQFVAGIAGAVRGVAALATFFTTGLVPALAAAGRAVLAFGAMLLTTPVGWILAAIAAIAFAAYEIYQNWDTIGPWFWRQWDTVKRAFSSAWEWIKSWMPEFVPDLIVDVWNALGEAFTLIWDTVKAVFTTVSGWLAGWIPQFVPDAITAAWNGLGDLFLSIWDVVRAAFVSAGSWLASWIPTFAPDNLLALWGSFLTFYDAMFAQAVAKFAAFATWFASWVTGFTPDQITKAWDSLVGFFDSLWGKITGIFDSAWGKISPIINAISAFASSIGGTIGGALGAIGLGGGPTPALAGAPGVLAPPPGAILGTPAGAPGAPGAAGTVDVKVNLAGNVPPGTTATATSTGNVRADVGQSMPLPY